MLPLFRAVVKFCGTNRLFIPHFDYQTNNRQRIMIDVLGMSPVLGRGAEFYRLVKSATTITCLIFYATCNSRSVKEHNLRLLENDFGAKAFSYTDACQVGLAFSTVQTL